MDGVPFSLFGQHSTFTVIKTGPDEPWPYVVKPTHFFMSSARGDALQRMFDQEVASAVRPLIASFIRKRGSTVIRFPAGTEFRAEVWPVGTSGFKGPRPRKIIAKQKDGTSFTVVEHVSHDQRYELRRALAFLRARLTFKPLDPERAEVLWSICFGPDGKVYALPHFPTGLKVFTLRDVARLLQRQGTEARLIQRGFCIGCLSEPIMAYVPEGLPVPQSRPVKLEWPVRYGFQSVVEPIVRKWRAETLQFLDPRARKKRKR